MDEKKIDKNEEQTIKTEQLLNTKKDITFDLSEIIKWFLFDSKTKERFDYLKSKEKNTQEFKMEMHCSRALVAYEIIKKNLFDIFLIIATACLMIASLYPSETSTHKTLIVVSIVLLFAITMQKLNYIKNLRDKYRW